MIRTAIADYTVSMAESIPEYYGEHTAHIEEFDLDQTNRSAFYVEVQRGFDWPFLCVVQRYSPNHWAGSHPGILLVPETHLLFIGAGERILAYDLEDSTRLWEDRAEFGFHHWRRHGGVVVLSAELELAAWDSWGVKRWTTFVEPPWEYHIDDGLVHLDVMGTRSSFPLLTGPAHT